MLSAFITAVRTLTVLPIPGRDAETMSSSLPFFPVVGAGIGSILYAVACCCEAVFKDQDLLSALGITLFSTVLTGALHLDGLADVADAFGGGHDKDRILEIMKDSRHGTFGVTAIVFDLGMKIIFVSLCLKTGHYMYIALSIFFSRTYQALGCTFFPYARPSGGTAAVFTSNKFRPTMLIIFLVQIGGTLYFTRSSDVAVMIVGSFLVTLLFFQYCHSKIGGITGDCIGSGNELAEISFLFIGILCCNFRGS